MMMGNYSFTFPLYVLSIIFLFNYGESLYFWVFLEFNLLFFILIMNGDKVSEGMIMKDSLNLLLYYFIIQSVASILFLNNYCFKESGSIFEYDLMFSISLCLKIGLFPLFFWVFNISKNLNFVSLFLLLTFQKIPLLSVFYSSHSGIILLILYLSFISGSIMLFFSSTFLMMMISSSVSYSFITFYLYGLSFSSFLSFFFIYSIMIFFILYNKSSLDGGLFSSNVLTFSFFFFLGLPPFSLFFYKFILTSEIVLRLGLVEGGLFWLVGFLGLFGYVKFFYSSIFWGSYLYFSQKILFNNFFVLFLSSIFFFSLFL